MPAPIVNLPSFGSGQNIEKLVNQLVQVESQPMQRWSRENQIIEAKIQAFKKLKEYSNQLEKKLEKFTSISFSGKKLVSYPEGFITGTTKDNILLSEQKIRILQLATFHQIATQKVNQSLILSPGILHIIAGQNEVKLNFKGGTIKDLYKLLENVPEKFYTVSLVRADSENYVLSLRANYSGKKNKIVFTDQNNVLQVLGIPKEKKKPSETFLNAKEKLDRKKLNFNLSQAKPFERGSFKNSIYKVYRPFYLDKKLIIKPESAFIFFLSKKYKYLSKINFQLDFQKIKKSENSFFEVGYVYNSEDGKKKVYRQKQKVMNVFSIPVSLKKNQSIEGILIGNSLENNLVFRSVSIEKKHFPIVSAEKVNLKIIQEAKDVILKLNGIEINRDKNEEIIDIFDGVSLNLLKTSDEKEIKLSIDANLEEEIKLLEDFVDAYNKLLEYIKQATKTEKIENITQRNDNTPIDSGYWDIKSRSGILAGDMTVLQLLRGLERFLVSVYPGKIKILSEIGISTGKIGSQNTNLLGSLSIEKDILIQELTNSPQEVKDLFAIDINSDGKIDDGIAHQMNFYLKHYNRFSGGIIENKIRQLKENLKSNQKKNEKF